MSSSSRIPVVDPLAYLIPCPVSSGATFSPQGELLCFGGAKLLKTTIYNSKSKSDQAKSQWVDQGDERDPASNSKAVDIHDGGDESKVKSTHMNTRPDIIKMAVEQTARDNTNVTVGVPFHYRHHSEAETTISAGSGKSEEDKEGEQKTSQVQETGTYAEVDDDNSMVDVDNASTDGNTANTNSTTTTNTIVLEPRMIGEAAQKAGKT